ncbi:unnamed protein product, partial [Phaeothamnion confervicola]
MATPSPSQKLFVGIDLGGTNAKAGLCIGGKLLESAAEALHSHEVCSVVQQLVDLAAKLLRQHGKGWKDVDGVGVCSPGQVVNGVVVAAACFPGWSNVPLQSWIKKLTSVKVTVVNDADAAAAAEAMFGYGHNKPGSTIAVFTLGTGVGLGLVLGGRPWNGSRGLVEGGHVIVDASPAARLCPCGQRGCLEAYVSATALSAIAAERLIGGGGGSGGGGGGGSGSAAMDNSSSGRNCCAVADCSGGGDNRSKEHGSSSGVVSPERLFQLAAAGDPEAERLVDETTRVLGLACLNLCRTIDPEAILFAGGVARAD